MEILKKKAQEDIVSYKFIRTFTHNNGDTVYTNDFAMDKKVITKDEISGNVPYIASREGEYEGFMCSDDIVIRTYKSKKDAVGNAEAIRKLPDDTKQFIIGCNHEVYECIIPKGTIYWEDDWSYRSKAIVFKKCVWSSDMYEKCRVRKATEDIPCYLIQCARGVSLNINEQGEEELIGVWKDNKTLTGEIIRKGNSMIDYMSFPYTPAGFWMMTSVFSNVRDAMKYMEKEEQAYKINNFCHLYKGVIRKGVDYLPIEEEGLFLSYEVELIEEIKQSL